MITKLARSRLSSVHPTGAVAKCSLSEVRGSGTGRIVDEGTSALPLQHTFQLKLTHLCVPAESAEPAELSTSVPATRPALTEPVLLPLCCTPLPLGSAASNSNSDSASSCSAVQVAPRPRPWAGERGGATAGGGAGAGPLPGLNGDFLAPPLRCFPGLFPPDAPDLPPLPSEPWKQEAQL